MLQADFKATVVCNEINLNRIGQHFGITRKFKWEDPLSLKNDHLKGIIREPENKALFIFHFGSMVFVNFQKHEMMDVANYLKRIEKSLNIQNLFEHIDDYRLEIQPEVEPSINNDVMVVPAPMDYQWEIVATILAKSVALEKIEIDIDLLLDEIEDIVEFLHQGKLSVSDEKLAKMSAKILGFKFNTISYIMLLDKPDITWTNEQAGELFADLGTLFELKDRYEKIRHKSDTLMDITEVFTGLAHAQRGNRLEWAIIILISLELILSILSSLGK
ncbi:MAG: RMD1 family protein [Bacillota bacterium]|nr:RMD1 family protein [Negativicutes bacterium]